MLLAQNPRHPGESSMFRPPKHQKYSGIVLGANGLEISAFLSTPRWGKSQHFLAPVYLGAQISAFLGAWASQGNSIVPTIRCLFENASAIGAMGKNKKWVAREPTVAKRARARARYRLIERERARDGSEHQGRKPPQRAFKKSYENKLSAKIFSGSYFPKLRRTGSNAKVLSGS